MLILRSPPPPGHEGPRMVPRRRRRRGGLLRRDFLAGGPGVLKWRPFSHRSVSLFLPLQGPADGGHAHAGEKEDSSVSGAVPRASGAKLGKRQRERWPLTPCRLHSLVRSFFPRIARPSRPWAGHGEGGQGQGSAEKKFLTKLCWWPFVTDPCNGVQGQRARACTGAPRTARQQDL